MTASLAHIFRHPIKAHGREALAYPSLGLRAVRNRELDVLLDVPVVEEVVALGDEADVLETVPGHRCVVLGKLATSEQVAALVVHVQPGEDPEESALAGAAAAQDRD